MTRPRHPKPELEAVLKEAEKTGWRVDRGNNYYKMWCPCGDHFKTVKITPRQNYKQNLLKELSRSTCWDKET